MATGHRVLGSYALAAPLDGRAGRFGAGDLDGGPPVRVELTRLDDAAAVDAFVEAVRTRLLVGGDGLERVVAFGREGDEGWVAVSPFEAASLDVLLEVAPSRGVAVPPELIAWIGARACRALHHLHTRTDGTGLPRGLALGGVGPERLRVAPDGHVVLDTSVLSVGSAAADVASLATTLRSALASPAVKGPLSPELVAAVAGGATSARALGEALFAASLGGVPDATWMEAAAGLVARAAGDELERRRDLVVEVVRAVCAVARLDLEGRRAAVVSGVRRGRLLAMAAVAALGLAGLIGGVVTLRRTAPVPPAFTRPETGTLALSLQPAARVLVDGVARGDGEAVEIGQLAPGPHTVTAESLRHETWTTEVRVVPGGVTRVAHALERIPDVAPARLHVESLPYGATVLVDGKAVGVTPLDWSTPRAHKVTVTVKKPGFADQKRQVKLASGRRAEVAVVLSPP